MRAPRMRVAIIAATIGVAAGVATIVVVPRLIAAGARRQLAAHGFPGATVEVGEVGLGHIELRDVRLADGADLGTVELDKGLGLLWGDPDEVTIRGARLSAAGLASVAGAMRGARSGGLPFHRVRVVDATVTGPDGASAVSATATATAAGLELSIEARDPSPHGWRATGTGTITWDAAGHAVLTGGHVDVSVPARALGRTTVSGATLSADVDGDLSAPAVSVRGTVAVKSAAVGGMLAVDDVHVPFTLRATTAGVTVAVARASASALGGELASEPFAITRGAPTDITVRASGLDLGRTLAALGHGRVHGTGALDGELVVRVAAGDWSIASAGLRTRDRGTIGVADAALRDRLAKLDSPFAVHQRIAGALADFAYDTLTAELGARTANPELRVTLRGHGRRNAQQLDLVLGVRGVRDVVGPRLTSRNP